MPMGSWIPQIRASRYQEGEAMIVCNDYRRGDFKPYIFRTTNFGQSWEQILESTNVQGYALCVLQDPVQPNLIFVGTEKGLWVSFDKGTSFEQWKNGYPSVSTYDLAIQEREADLCIATFGRAIYVMDDIRPLRKFAANGGGAPKKKLVVFEAPTAYEVQFKNKMGYDYSTWGLYDGKNRSRGASYSFYIQPSAKKDTAKSSKTDSVWVKIYNPQNELIRTMQIKADTGFNRNYWGFETKGLRRLGSPKPKASSPEPLGDMPVFPGTYKMVISLGKEADSTMIVVQSAPGQTISQQVYDSKVAALNRLEKSTSKVVEIADRLTEADEIIAKVEAQLKNVEGAEADSLLKFGKGMTDSIKKIRNFIFGTPHEKQGYGGPYEVTVNGRLYDAKGEILAKNKIPDAQEFTLIEMAEKVVVEAVEKANSFFNSKWKQYRQKADATPMKIFKEFKEL
jgi:hypothetical protein